MKSLEAACDAIDSISFLLHLASVDADVELSSVSLNFKTRKSARNVKRNIQRDIQSMEVVPLVRADNPDTLLIHGTYIHFNVS